MVQFVNFFSLRAVEGFFSLVRQTEPEDLPFWLLILLFKIINKYFFFNKIALEILIRWDLGQRSQLWVVEDHYFGFPSVKNNKI